MKFTATHLTVVIVAFLAAITTLALANRDTAALIAVGIAILGGLGLSLGQQQAVKENTNGTMTRTMGLLENVIEKLAKLPPIPEDKEPPD